MQNKKLQKHPRMQRNKVQNDYIETKATPTMEIQKMWLQFLRKNQF